MHFHNFYNFLHSFRCLGRELNKLKQVHLIRAAEPGPKIFTLKFTAGEEFFPEHDMPAE